MDRERSKDSIWTELAVNALRAYGLEDIELELIKVRRKNGKLLAERRDGKLVFRVSAPGQPEMTLKLYSDPTSSREKRIRSEEALRSQLLWQEALIGEAGISVQEPIRTSEGEFTARISTGSVQRDRISVLTSWISGEVKLPEELTLDGVRAMGAYTARLHRHAEQYSEPEGMVRPRWDWHRTFGRSAMLWKRGGRYFSEGEMQTFRAAARFAHRDMKALGEGREVFGLIHRDIQAKNLVFGEEGISAIDFESCGWGYYLFDLALISFRLEALGGRHEALHEALIEGYREVREISDRHLSYLETFVVMRMVERVSVLLHRESPTTKGQGVFYLPAAARRMERFVETKRNRGATRFVPSGMRRSLLGTSGRLRGILGRVSRRVRHSGKRAE